MVDANTIIKEAVNVGGDIVLTIIGENDNKEQIRKRLILDKKDFLVGGFDVYQEFKKMKNQRRGSCVSVKLSNLWLRRE